MMKVIYKFETLKVFGNIPSFYLWIEIGRKYDYLCTQRNQLGAAIQKVRVSRKQSLECIEKGLGFTVDFMSKEGGKRW